MDQNKSLKALVIEDFSKITNVSTLSSATSLDYLILEGGMWKPLKLDTLEPLTKLINLQFLRLANMRVKEDGLKPISHLKNIKELMLSNQFETSDYAYLAAKLPNTQCDHFKPYIKYDKPIGDHDIMITGKRKPFLNSELDKVKIEKYVLDFNNMVKQFSIGNY